MTDTMPNLKRSIKRYDTLLPNGYTSMQIFGFDGLQPHLLPDLPDLLRHGSSPFLIDQALRATLLSEGMWASAAAIAVSAVVSQAWEIEGDVPRRNQQAREIVEYMPYIETLEKIVMDYLTSNNGCFPEIIRTSGARGSKVLGYDHLDSAYCRRTGDTEIPVIYTSADGRERELKWYQVFDLVDQPSPSRDAMGRGICAAYRAYTYIRQVATVEQYVIEKVGGKRPLAIYIVNNLASATLESGIATATNPMAAPAEDEYRPAQAYMSALIIPSASNEAPVVAKIDLAGLPDGFDADQIFSKCLLAYAKALGLDPADLKPMTGQGLGVNGQSEIQHKKAASFGIGTFKQKWREGLKRHAIPAGTMFVFSESDLDRKKTEAELAKLHTDTAAVQVEKLGLTPAQALEYLVDEGDLPEQFRVAPDTTPDLSVGSDDPVETAAEAVI